MEFKKADVAEKIAVARRRDPRTFDRIIESAIVGSSNECWPIIRGLNRDGYGVLRVGGRKQRAHRVIFGLFYPSVPAIVVRHVCNNPACVNPSHLRGGTQKNNAEDRVNSGRGGDLRGEANGRSKLTVDQVIAIRDSSLSGTELARIHGISKVMACRIKRGAAWSHLNQGGI